MVDDVPGPLSAPIALGTPPARQVVGMVVGALVLGAAAFFAGWGHHMSLPAIIVTAVGYAAAGAVCGWAALIDITEHRLPNRLTYPLIPAVFVLLTILSIVDFKPSRIGTALIAALLSGALFGVAALVVPTGIGMGDAKFAVSTGALAGWWSYVTAMWAIFHAFFFAAIVALILVAVRRATAKTPIPFGPFLLLGAVSAIWWNVSASPFSW